MVPKCDIPTGQTLSDSARLAVLVADLLYARHDRSNPFGGGGRFPAPAKLTHHVTSHWPSAQVTTAPAEESAALTRMICERAPDAVLLQADFADEQASGAALNHMAQMLLTQPTLHCIVLAQHGSEVSAVRAMKSGAKDYLALKRISRDALLTAIGEAVEKRRAADQASKGLAPADAEGSGVHVPGYAIQKDIAASNFSQVFLARSERLRRNPFRGIRVRHVLSILRCVDDGGQHGVDVDALLPQLGGHRLGEPHDTGFGRGVGTHLCTASLRSECADVDDFAARSTRR